MRTFAWLVAGAAVVFASGCVAFGGAGAEGGSGGGAEDTTTKDVAAWNALSKEYDARRTMFLDGDVQDLAAVGNQLFWFDTTSFDAKLDRYDDTTKKKLAYQFAIGSGDLANYRASSSLVVTADPTADPPVYHAYDANAPMTEIGETTIPKPLGAQWAAYAVSDGTVYIVDTSVAGMTTLDRWTPGQDPAPVTTLESAGVTVGEFEDFAVSGTTMVFIESGRIWKMDLSTNKATWLMNKTEVDGAVDFRDDGVMFGAADGLMFFDYQSQRLVNLTDRIDENAFKINDTYPMAAHYLQDFARWKSYVLYVGESGLFAYDMSRDTIVPILLSPESAMLRVDYRYPVALDDGTAFVTGLTSTDGAVGADGPTYRLDLTSILK